MNSRENFQAMLAGGRPERLPFHVPVTPPVADRIAAHTGERDPALAFDTDFRVCGVRWRDDPAAWRAALDAELGVKLPPEAEIGPWGISHVAPPAGTTGDAYHFRTMLHPLEAVTDVSQLPRLPWLDPADPRHYDEVPARVAAVHAAGKVVWAGLECTVFEHAWYLRGMDNLFGDLAEENGIADWLLDYFTERSVQANRAFARAGVELFALGDDVGTQHRLLLSAPMWRRHLKPRLARVIAAIRESAPGRVWVQYHSDGDVTEIVPELIEIGVDILNPVQPECMDAAALARDFGRRLGLCGMVGTQTTMPFGTPDDVRRRVAEIAALHRQLGARVIASPTHVLEPDVPLENILAFVDAARAARF